MEIVLLQDVENLGTQSELVKVKAGYARNYLIPKGMAIVANDSNKKHAEEIRKQGERREELLMSQLQDIVDALKNKTVTVGAKVGTSGKIFGSVTSIQLADAIKKQLHINIDRKKITILEEIKTLGTFKAEIDLHQDVKVETVFEVVGE